MIQRFIAERHQVSDLSPQAKLTPQADARTDGWRQREESLAAIPYRVIDSLDLGALAIRPQHARAERRHWKHAPEQRLLEYVHVAFHTHMPEREVAARLLGRVLTKHPHGEARRERRCTVVGARHVPHHPRADPICANAAARRIEAVVRDVSLDDPAWLRSYGRERRITMNDRNG